VQRDRGDAEVGGDAARLEVGEVVVVDAEPQLDRDGHVAGGPTAAATIAAYRSVRHGSAAPPPWRVTFGAGQPKLRSMWSTRPSSTSSVGRRGRVVRVGRVQLDRPGVSSGANPALTTLDLRVALDQPAGADHLGDVQPAAVAAAQGAEGRVGDARHRGEHDRRPHPDGLQHLLAFAPVERDDAHRFGHRQDGARPVCRAVRSAERWRVPVSLVDDRRVRHQVDVGPQDAFAGVVQDQGAVHLGQLRDPLGRGRGVDQEATRGDAFDGVVPADDEQRTTARADDTFDAVADGGAGSQHGEHLQAGRARWSCPPLALPLGVSARVGPVRQAPCILRARRL
jgi:hypothetical protein